MVLIEGLLLEIYPVCVSEKQPKLKQAVGQPVRAHTNNNCQE